MHAAVIVFPGSNCDRDMAVAFERPGRKVSMVWHKDTASCPTASMCRPAGRVFLRRLPALRRDRRQFADLPLGRGPCRRGGYVLGICNGFQVLTETGLLPGVLLRNAGLKYICKPVDLTVETADSAFHVRALYKGPGSPSPSHRPSRRQLFRRRGHARPLEARIASPFATDNPNGSARDIAGILSENRRVLGMMPHPERMADPAHGNTEGRRCSTGSSAQLASRLSA